jgi:ABC-type transport system involved in multi-copper enzyme maturation permease subunit
MSALLALFLRAVRDDARSKSTYWLRAGFVALMLLFMQGSFSLSQWVGAPGLQVFNQVLWMNIFFISIAGLSYFASSITEEKEDDTLSLLRMTDLNPLAILLGKSTGRIAGALLLLAVQLPFTILATSLGGVSLAQVLAAYATLGAYLFFLANLALIFSVLCRRTSLAATLTGLTLVLFFWLPGWIAFFRGISLSMVALDYDTTSTALEKFLFAWWRASPLVRLKEILSTGFHAAPLGWQVASDLALGIICFGIAWALFDRCADRAVEGTSLGGGSGVRPSRRATARLGRPWRQPLMWKDFHYMVGGLRAVGFKVVICLGIVGLMIWVSFKAGNVPLFVFGYFTMAIMALVWTADLALAASRIFRVELRGQTLSSLASLPLSLATIARQKALGCLLASWPEVLFFFCGFALLAPELSKWLKRWPSEMSPDLTGFFFTVTITAAGIAFFVHLVAWLSLRVKFGALPLAMVISFVGMQIAGIAFAFIFGMMKIEPEVAASLILIFLLLAAAGLHATIPRRLAQLAAEP